MDATRDISTATPSDADVFQALLAVGTALGHRYAYWLAGSYHFTLTDDWTIALSAESAGRVRIDACLHGRARFTLWSLASDRGRLASIAIRMESQVHGALAA